MLVFIGAHKHVKTCMSCACAKRRVGRAYALPNTSLYSRIKRWSETALIMILLFNIAPTSVCDIQTIEKTTNISLTFLFVQTVVATMTIKLLINSNFIPKYDDSCSPIFYNIFKITSCHPLAFTRLQPLTL